MKRIATKKIRAIKKWNYGILFSNQPIMHKARINCIWKHIQPEYNFRTIGGERRQSLLSNIEKINV